MLWFFYVPLTAIVILALVTIPTRLLENSLHPIELDAAITKERLFQDINKVGSVYGVEPGVIRPDFATRALLMGDKKWAYKLTVTTQGQNTPVIVFGNEEFYRDAAPLAPVKYSLFQSERKYSSTVSVKVDEVYPKKYEKFS